MTEELKNLVEAARKVKMTDSEKAEQRISFVYGTTKIENENITREMVSKIAKKTLVRER